MAKRLIEFRISIHALLAESDVNTVIGIFIGSISIHALLAESDTCIRDTALLSIHFYPRSPCGERQALGLPGWLRTLISIHALLAESDPGKVKVVEPGFVFLSTLSLRRATRTLECTYNAHADFYPRSPCGERQCQLHYQDKIHCISIHALLAESD